MAYLSRQFWKTPEERRAAPGSATMPGADGLGTPSVGNSGPAGTPGADLSGQGSPGAIRSFFEQNKDQGAQVLGGLADSLTQRISGAQAGMTAPTIPGQFNEAQPTAPHLRSGFHPDENLSEARRFQSQMKDWMGRRTAADAARTAATEAGAANAATQTAGIQPIGQDVKLLGQGQEGAQTLLAAQHGADRGGYTGGQSRADAWLAGSAQNTQPGTVQAVQQQWHDLAGAAGNQGNAGPAPMEARPEAPRIDAFNPGGSYDAMVAYQNRMRDWLGRQRGAGKG